MRDNFVFIMISGPVLVNEILLIEVSNNICVTNLKILKRRRQDDPPKFFYVAQPNRKHRKSL